MPFNQLFEIGSLTVRNPGSRYQAYRKPLTIAKVFEFEKFFDFDTLFIWVASMASTRSLYKSSNDSN